jgi:hypothetical protein
MHVKAALLALAMMLGAGGAAQATIVVYTSQTAFLAAISGAATDSFNDLEIESLGSSITRSAGAYSYQVSADSGLWGAGDNGGGWISTASNADPIVFSNFTGGVSAIGGLFFGSNIDGGFANLYLISVTATDASGAQAWEQILHPNQNSFLGFTSSDGLQSLQVVADGFPTDGLTPEQIAAYQQWPTANNVILGQSPQDPPPPPPPPSPTATVPEPATWALTLSGFVLIGAALRGRRRSRVSFG